MLILYTVIGICAHRPSQLFVTAAEDAIASVGLHATGFKLATSPIVKRECRDSADGGELPLPKRLDFNEAGAAPAGPMVVKKEEGGEEAAEEGREEAAEEGGEVAAEEGGEEEAEEGGEEEDGSPMVSPQPKPQPLAPNGHAAQP